MKGGCTLLSGLRLVSAGLLLLTSTVTYADMIVVPTETVTLNANETLTIDGHFTINNTGKINGNAGAKLKLTGNWDGSNNPDYQI